MAYRLKNFDTVLRNSFCIRGFTELAWPTLTLTRMTLLWVGRVSETEHLGEVTYRWQDPVLPITDPNNFMWVIANRGYFSDPRTVHYIGRKHASSWCEWHPDMISGRQFAMLVNGQLQLKITGPILDHLTRIEGYTRLALTQLTDHVEHELAAELLERLTGLKAEVRRESTRAVKTLDSFIGA